MGNELKLGLAVIKKEGDEVSLDPLYRDRENIKFTPPIIKVLENMYYESPNPTTQYECKCGSREFTVHYKAGGYETSVKCVKCSEAHVVHEG